MRYFPAHDAVERNRRRKKAPRKARSALSRRKKVHLMMGNGSHGSSWITDPPKEEVLFGMDISLLDLFMLRTLVIKRIQELKILLEKRETNQPANEMLDIYEPLFQKIDGEIEKRSVSSR